MGAHNDEIGFEIKVIANLIKRSLNGTADANECTGMQGRIIGYLFKNTKDVFQKDIEKVFNIRRSTATNILQLMEKNDLLVREAVDYDARLKKLMLTDKAIRLVEDFERRIKLLENKITKDLTDEEIKTFLLIASKIKSNLES